MAHRALRAVRGRDAAAHPPFSEKTSYNKNNPAEAGLQTYILGVSLLSEKINSFVSPYRQQEPGR